VVVVQDLTYPLVEAHSASSTPSYPSQPFAVPPPASSWPNSLPSLSAHAIHVHPASLVGGGSRGFLLLPGFHDGDGRGWIRSFELGGIRGLEGGRRWEGVVGDSLWVGSLRVD
jgi:hypothetical protein